MKPTRDGEGVARLQPPRILFDPIYSSLNQLECEMNLIDRIKRADENKGPWPTGVELILAISSAEKRVEEMAFKMADDQFWKLKAEQAERERDELRNRLDILAAQFEIECELHDKTRSALHIPRG